MPHGRFCLVLLTALIAMGISISLAHADGGSSTGAMQKQIDQLEAKVQALENQQAQSQADLTAAINKVVQEAEQRSQLLSATGSTAGYDEATGFHIGSEDGNFLFHPYALFQFRGDLDYRTNHHVAKGELAPDSGTSTQDGFEIRRLQIGLSGNIISPNLRYCFQWRTDSYSNGLQDAYVTYRLSDNSPWTIKAGQFIDPVWHEGNVSAGQILAADRSLVDAFIGGGFASAGASQERIQGLGTIYNGGTWRATGVFHDGAASQGSDFAHNAPALIAGLPAENYGASGRFEYKVIGPDSAWGEYEDFTAEGNKSDLLVLGAGSDYTEAGSNHAIAWTTDAQWENTSGVGVYAAFLGQYVDLANNNGSAILPPTGNYNSYGYLIQGSYAFSPRWEAFGRYDFTHLDDGLYSSPSADDLEHNIHEITVGLNYYLHGHRAKFTIDGSWLPNGSPADLPAMGILRNNGQSEFIIRGQIQVQI